MDFESKIPWAKNRNFFFQYWAKTVIEFGNVQVREFPDDLSRRHNNIEKTEYTGKNG